MNTRQLIILLFFVITGIISVQSQRIGDGCVDDNGLMHYDNKVRLCPKL